MECQEQADPGAVSRTGPNRASRTVQGPLTVRGRIAQDRTAQDRIAQDRIAQDRTARGRLTVRACQSRSTPSRHTTVTGVPRSRAYRTMSPVPPRPRAGRPSQTARSRSQLSAM